MGLAPSEKCDAVPRYFYSPEPANCGQHTAKQNILRHSRAGKLSTQPLFLALDTAKALFSSAPPAST
jgi:hypothetical protein